MTRRKAVRKRKALNRDLRLTPRVRRDFMTLQARMRRALYDLLVGRHIPSVDPCEVSAVCTAVAEQFFSARTTRDPRTNDSFAVLT